MVTQVGREEVNVNELRNGYLYMDLTPISKSANRPGKPGAGFGAAGELFHEFAMLPEEKK